MTRTFIINPRQAIINGATSGFCILVALVMAISLGHPGSAAIFFIIGVIFVKPFLDSVGTVTLGPERLTRKLPFRPDFSMTWDEIAEVGLAGESVLNMGRSNRPGTIHFYFSGTVLDDDKRFDMMMHWPPKDKIYLTWSKKRMEFIRPLCGRDIIKYNTGNKQV